MKSKNKIKFEKIYIDDIQPSEYNPRVMDQSEMDKLSQNLEEFGLVDPIIINLQNNHIIGGHQRYAVLRNQCGTDVDYENKELNLLRLGDVGWVFDDTELKIQDENHEKALNVSLNNISGDWDWDKLDTLLSDLNEQHFNIDLTGFNDFELDIDDFKLDIGSFSETNTTATTETTPEEDEIDRETIDLDDTVEEFVDITDDDDYDDDYDGDDFINSFESSLDDETPTPSDFVEVTGELPNKNYLIILAFTEKDKANDFIKYLGSKRKLKDKTMHLKHEVDFTFELDDE